MSTITVANVNLDSSGNNQIRFFGANSIQIVAGGANVAVINSSMLVLAASIIGSGFGGIINIQSFSANGTYTRSTGAGRALIFATGGGGGGGGAGLLANNAPGGAGGGAGATAIALINVASIATATITIGSGGSVSSGNTAGAAGSNTLFVNAATTYVSCNGGAGGATTNVPLASAAGGTGGVATFNSCLFSLSITGASGEATKCGPSAAPALPGKGGDGGGSFWGSGAPGSFNFHTATVVNGATAISPGSGGAGATANASTAATGGTGGNGLTVVFELS